MIYISIAIFALAALFGLVILVNWLKDKEASKAVIYSHGGAAVIAVVLLVIYALQHPDNFPLASLVLFGIAAVAGLYMFLVNRKEGKRPLGIALTHAFVAVTGFVLLVIFAFI